MGVPEATAEGAAAGHAAAGHALEVIDLVGGVFGLLLIAAAALAFCKKTRLPFTVTLVLLGIGIKQLGLFADFRVSPDIILFVFLPTLIFESAFNLNARQLLRNIVPVMTLAVPGLLLSTVIIGVIVHYTAGMEIRHALLLGAILSATDPVAVISLFKQLGAPLRLTVLVEGESLFNDASCIVVAKILIVVVAATLPDLSVSAAATHGAEAPAHVQSAGADTPAAADTAAAHTPAAHGEVTVGGSLLMFFRIFFGGLLVGILMGAIFGWILGFVKSDPFIEISMTTILAYASFIVAEHYLHVSGVMATVGAGIVMGGWGRTKISPAIHEYLEEFWEFLGYIANALIFLLVGLLVDIQAVGNSLGTLVAVIVAMQVSRAICIYGLAPLIGKVSEPVERSYQTVMFWGGLRGAVALAVALALPHEFRELGKNFPMQETFVAVVMGAVLFTLIVQGLTIEKLVRFLKLDRPPLSERRARVEGLLSSKHRALERIPELQKGGLFSAGIAETMTESCRKEQARLKVELEGLRQEGMDRDQELNLLYLRGLAMERSFYYEMYGKGHLSERAYRDLAHLLELQADAIRYGGRVLDPMQELARQHTGEGLQRLLDAGLGFTPIPDRFRAARTARAYEALWGRHLGTARVLGDLEEIAEAEGASPDVVQQMRASYQKWHDDVRTQIDETTEQFPEFVAAMQTRLARRLVIHAEREVIEEQAHAGSIPHGVAEAMLETFDEEIREGGGYAVSELHVDPTELLRKVPFFKDTPEAEFARIAAKLHERTTPAGEVIIRQGGPGDSLFLIARGVVRVSRDHDGVHEDLATLLPGEFFGEMALLHREPRSATCRAVTPAALYELRHADFTKLCEVCPATKAAVESADQKRRSREG